MESLYTTKQQLRKRSQKLRYQLSPRRLGEGRKALAQLKVKGSILSFISFRGEIDTSCLNKQLLEEKRLYLPKVEGTQLQCLKVNDLDKLVRSPWGILEPICGEDWLAEQLTALIPALAFRQDGHRLGYGKGFYDRFLKAHPQVHSIGVGFKEQIALFPIEAHDHPLDQLLLL